MFCPGHKRFRLAWDPEASEFLIARQRYAAHTLSFLAIAAIPFLFLIVGAIYIPVAILVAPFIWFASRAEERSPRLMKWLFAREFQQPRRRYLIPTFMFQFVFYSLVVSLSPKYVLLAMNRYSTQIEAIKASSIYAFDMYPGAECSAAVGFRVAALGDERYILASKTSDGVTFEKPRKCVIDES